MSNFRQHLDSFRPMRLDLSAAQPVTAACNLMFTRFFYLITLLIIVSALIGCASYGERVAPVPLPEAQADHVDVDGVKLVARPYVEDDDAKAAFGFDIRGSGLLPVRFVIDNQSGREVTVRPGQTFLIDKTGQAWPLLTAEQAYQRVRSHTELGETAKGTIKPALLLGAAGAVAGFAVGVISGKNIGESAAKGAALGASAGAIYGGATRHQSVESLIREDLARESLQNVRVRRGELAYGYLFFPGKDEADSAMELRLGLDIGSEKTIVHLPL